MPRHNRGINQLMWKKKTDPKPEPIEVEEEKETKNGKDTNEEKEAKRESELEDKIHGSVVYIGVIPTDATEEEIKEFCKDSGEVVELNDVYRGHVESFIEASVKCSMALSKGERKRHAELLSKPPHGSEVKIVYIPADSTEEELKEFRKAAGEVVEVRLVRKNNKVIAFVSFRTVEMASEAIKELDNSEFKGKQVRCSRHLKNTIFIGNIPREWVESDLKNVVKQAACPGVTHVDLMKDPSTGLSWGFGYVDYYNHAGAKYSLKRKLPKLDIKLDSNSPTIRFKWADSRVRVVYEENLPKDVTDKQIKELFERHCDIEKVDLPPPKAGHEKRYAFVHFRERADAMKALQNTERYELQGDVLNCSLAKPNEYGYLYLSCIWKIIRVPCIFNVFPYLFVKFASNS